MWGVGLGWMAWRPVGALEGLHLTGVDGMTIETLASIDRGREQEAIRALGRVVWYEHIGPDQGGVLRTKRVQLHTAEKVLRYEWLKDEELAAVLLRVTSAEGSR